MSSERRPKKKLRSKIRLREIHTARLKKREKRFDLSGIERADIPRYEPLLDKNLSHFFSSPKVQRHLYRVGLIDREGRILDVDRNRQKLNIIEQEFRQAEREEMMRLRDEDERAYREKVKRREEMDTMKKLARVEKIREQRQERRTLASRGPTAYEDGRPRTPKRGVSRGAGSVGRGQGKRNQKKKTQARYEADERPPSRDMQQRDETVGLAAVGEDPFPPPPDEDTQVVSEDED